ncbi:MAG: 3-dehydroquinate synthase [Omnitrophica bacterium RIFCSPLOWO2_12_FULL_50_11]|nr:MAG: 3-dehydroquinate synthase [Omnitrophica bacterium RIFCSPLOWO2_12_FULL_50_11]
MKRIYLRSSQGCYPILIGRNLLRCVGSLMRKVEGAHGRAPQRTKVFIVSNRTVARYYLAPVQHSLERSGFRISRFLLPYGSERDKSEGVLRGLWSEMARVPLERTSTVVALGGGVVGDVSGLAASTYMRGISLVHVPTTLLAQVDSAIGGKTAINLAFAKNIIGTFYQPKMVISDVDTLKTMSLREWRNSFAEVIKYGVIGDPKLFRLLELRVEWFFSSLRKKAFGSRVLSFLETVIWRCARVKATVVEGDEYETKGMRMILNYGHTFAHALEADSGYRLPHGEAVAMGMVLAAKMACQNGSLTSSAGERQRRLLEKMGLPVRPKSDRLSVSRLLAFMKRDKKARGGKLTFILPRSIGRVEVRRGISRERVRNILRAL